jgi:hypothetical protein
MRKTIDEKLIPMRQNYAYHLERTNSVNWLLLAILRSLFDFKGYDNEENVKNGDKIPKRNG